MKTEKFVYRSGSRYAVSPTVVARELARIAEGGGVEAKRVVDAARPAESVLHPIFQWDDEKAGEMYRLIQARRLIRAVQVVRGDEAPRRIYVHVESPENEGEYVPLKTIVQHPDAYALALAEATRRLAAAQEAIAELHEAARGVKPEEYVARIALAAQALSTAEQAVRALH